MSEQAKYFGKFNGDEIQFIGVDQPYEKRYFRVPVTGGSIDNLYVRLSDGAVFSDSNMTNRVKIKRYEKDKESLYEVKNDPEEKFVVCERDADEGINFAQTVLELIIDSSPIVEKIKKDSVGAFRGPLKLAKKGEKNRDGQTVNDITDIVDGHIVSYLIKVPYLWDTQFAFACPNGKFYGIYEFVDDFMINPDKEMVFSDDGFKTADQKLDKDESDPRKVPEIMNLLKDKEGFKVAQKEVKNNKINFGEPEITQDYAKIEFKINDTSFQPNPVFIYVNRAGNVFSDPELSTHISGIDKNGSFKTGAEKINIKTTKDKLFASLKSKLKTFFETRIKMFDSTYLFEKASDGISFKVNVCQDKYELGNVFFGKDGILTDENNKPIKEINEYGKFVLCKDGEEPINLVKDPEKDLLLKLNTKKDQIDKFKNKLTELQKLEQKKSKLIYDNFKMSFGEDYASVNVYLDGNNVTNVLLYADGILRDSKGQAIKSFDKTGKIIFCKENETPINLSSDDEKDLLSKFNTTEQCLKEFKSKFDKLKDWVKGIRFKTPELIKNNTVAKIEILFNDKEADIPKEGKFIYIDKDGNIFFHESLAEDKKLRDIGFSNTVSNNKSYTRYGFCAAKSKLQSLNIKESTEERLCNSLNAKDKAVRKLRADLKEFFGLQSKHQGKSKVVYDKIFIDSLGPGSIFVSAISCFDENNIGRVSLWPDGILRNRKGRPVKAIDNKGSIILCKENEAPINLELDSEADLISKLNTTKQYVDIFKSKFNEMKKLVDCVKFGKPEFIKENTVAKIEVLFDGKEVSDPKDKKFIYIKKDGTMFTNESLSEGSMLYGIDTVKRVLVLDELLQVDLRKGNIETLICNLHAKEEVINKLRNDLKDFWDKQNEHFEESKLVYKNFRLNFNLEKSFVSADVYLDGNNMTDVHFCLDGILRDSKDQAIKNFDKTGKIIFCKENEAPVNLSSDDEKTLLSKLNTTEQCIKEFKNKFNELKDLSKGVSFGIPELVKNNTVVKIEILFGGKEISDPKDKKFIYIGKNGFVFSDESLSKDKLIYLIDVMEHKLEASQMGDINIKKMTVEELARRFSTKEENIHKLRSDIKILFEKQNEHSEGFKLIYNDFCISYMEDGSPYVSANVYLNGDLVNDICLVLNGDLISKDFSSIKALNKQGKIVLCKENEISVNLTNENKDELLLKLNTTEESLNLFRTWFDKLQKTPKKQVTSDQHESLEEPKEDKENLVAQECKMVEPEISIDLGKNKPEKIKVKRRIAKIQIGKDGEKESIWFDVDSKYITDENGVLIEAGQTPNEKKYVRLDDKYPDIKTVSVKEGEKELEKIDFDRNNDLINSVVLGYAAKDKELNKNQLDALIQKGLNETKNKITVGEFYKKLGEQVSAWIEKAIENGDLKSNYTKDDVKNYFKSKFEMFKFVKVAGGISIVAGATGLGTLGMTVLLGFVMLNPILFISGLVASGLLSTGGAASLITDWLFANHNKNKVLNVDGIKPLEILGKFNVRQEPKNDYGSLSK